MNQERLVLVTGATGRQGGAVARHLLDAGFRVRILARDPSRPAAVALRDRGAEVVRGDLRDPASLVPALEGAYGVFSVQNYWEKGVGYEGEIRQGKNLVDAARAAGVRHFVQASIADAEKAPGVEHFACKTWIEQYVDRIGLPRTFLGEVFYMENFLDPKAGSMMLPVLAGTLEQDTRLHMISVEDIGAIAAAVFQHPEQYLGRKIDVAGDRLTVGQMREAYERVTGKRAKRWAMPGVVLRLMLAEMYRQLKWNNGPGWRFDPAETRRVVPGVTSFEQFLRKHPGLSL